MTGFKTPNWDVDEETSRLLSPQDAVHGDAPFLATGYGAAASEDAEGVGSEAERGERKTYDGRFIAQVVLALLIGVFTSNADGSLVLATHPVIASEFGNLQDSGWLVISFLLAGAATQALYGKLSDIFGRKKVLILCYGIFAAGCALVGVGQTMWQVILGRVISGSGGAGMISLASVIITELAPLRDVAFWQSYMNIIATVGRSIGGPLGGWLADTIGWRWSFLGQAPIFVAAMVLCGFMLPSSGARQSGEEASMRSRLARIDGLGSTLLGVGVLLLLLPLEIGGTKVGWTHPLIFSSLGLGIILLGLFAAVQLRWAKEPVFPIRLLKSPDVSLSYLIMAAQCGAQLGMMFTVPLYFKVTQRVSNTEAGAHLFPAVVGNTVGGVLSGMVIQRTGRYKKLVICSAILSASSYTLMMLRWHGNTSWAESLYIIPGGMGTGIAQSAVFIAVQTAILPRDKAAATSGFFMMQPIGIVLGLAGSSAIMQGVLRSNVQADLQRLGLTPEKIDKILRKVAENMDYIDHAPKQLADVVVKGYVLGLEYAHGLSILFSLVALVLAAFLRERKL